MTTILAAGAVPADTTGSRIGAAPRPLLSVSSWLMQAATFPVVVLAVLFVGTFLLIPQSIADPDIWWHLRNAQLQLLHHALLRHDTYSFTAYGAPWINHEWLAELPFFFAWKLFGPSGLFLVSTALIEAIFFGIFLLSWRASRSLAASLAVSLLGALLATVSFGPRTLLFGWLYLVVELLLLQSLPSHPARAYSLPPLFLLWVNTHGSWLIGIALLAIFFLCGLPDLHYGSISNPALSSAQRRVLGRVLALSLACLFVNPYGWRLVAYPFNLAFAQKLNLENVEEWKTLDFHSPRGRIFLLVLAFFFLAQLLRRRSWTLRDLAFLGVGVYAALTYSRFLFLAAILLMPLAASCLANRPPPSAPAPAKVDRPWANALLLLLLAVLFLRHLPRRDIFEHAGQEAYPLRATNFLAHANLPGNGWNDYLWGGFLIWNTPQVPVLIDSRVDIFEYNGVFRDYLDAVRMKNTLGILDKYNIRYVVFSRNTPLVYLLEHTSGWTLRYEDATTSILERAKPAQPSGTPAPLKTGRP